MICCQTTGQLWDERDFDTTDKASRCLGRPNFNDHAAVLPHATQGATSTFLNYKKEEEVSDMTVFEKWSTQRHNITQRTKWNHLSQPRYVQYEWVNRWNP